MYTAYRQHLEPHWPLLPPEGTLVALGTEGQGLKMWRSTGIAARHPEDWDVSPLLAHPNLDLASDDVYRQLGATGLISHSYYAEAMSKHHALWERLMEAELPETTQTGTDDNEWSHDWSGDHHTTKVRARESLEDPLGQAMQGLTLNQAHVDSRHGNVRHTHGDVPYTQHGSAAHTQHASVHVRPGAPAAGVSALLPPPFDSRATDPRQQRGQPAESHAQSPRTSSHQGGPRRGAAR
ncbi:hypothetical protein O7599_29180 [Streptomyces sp. WMMC500]|uniref:hypothetical protein n=1 Tax=Streptomyces sp. WMMC500 TaxID=3015154 RepID=UPI00248AA30F|nr:hypothetical protein [Streptomyces sp. WMMC500]WBB59600.1 hypothetical protein O7599_29180 [Streptomyces sp. WMMC500]